MIELILHPGHSKCGSTSIQDFLYKNRHVLKKRGIFMPDVEFNFPGDRAYKINRTQTPRDYLEKVITGEVSVDCLEEKLKNFLSKSEKLGCRKIIITAENLVNGISSQNQKLIHSLFSDCFQSIKIVYYVRNQESLLSSAWQQWGHKKGLTLDEYIDGLLKTKFGDYSFIAKKLQSYYSHADITVCTLDKNTLIEGSLMSDFCVRSGINSKGLTSHDTNDNIGLSSSICESLAKIHTIYGSPHSQKVKNEILSLTPNSYNLVTKKYPIDLSSQTKKKIYKRFFESNQELSEDFFDGEKVFPLYENHEVQTEMNEINILKQKIDKLEDLVAIQMDMLLTLSEKR